MNDLLKTPADFIHHIRRYTSSVANSIIYGQRAATYEDFWGHVSHHTCRSGSKADGEQIVYEVMDKVIPDWPWYHKSDG